MKTFSLKSQQITKNWLLIDADKAVLGRLAVISANILRGKNKPEYTPNQDCGDNLIIINSDKIALTGKKQTDKLYYNHTGYPGGLRTTPYRRMQERHPDRIIRKAVQGMLPHTKLGRLQLKKLRVYAGGDHRHEAQNPQPLEL